MHARPRIAKLKHGVAYVAGLAVALCAQCGKTKVTSVVQRHHAFADRDTGQLGDAAHLQLGHHVLAVVSTVLTLTFSVAAISLAVLPSARS